MKSLNTKIIIIIIAGLFLQIVLVGSLYRLLIAKQIIASVNSHETARQKILQGAILNIEKAGDNLGKIQEIINLSSSKNDVSFVLKDLEGNTIAIAEPSKRTARNLQEMGFVKFGKKPKYILYCEFPLKIKNFAISSQLGNSRAYLILVIILVSSIISFLVYEVLSRPLNKLRRAMGKVDYGNTLIEIPYYGNDELGLLCRNFEEMGRRLKKSEESQTEVIQAISHDLKTPLTSIIGYVKRLTDGRITSEEKLREYYEIIYRKAKDVRDLLEELDEYTSVNAKSKYNLEAVECRKLFEDICREFKDEMGQSGINLEYNNSLSEDQCLNIDRAKIRRVFGNIIENSVKYGGEGSKIFINCFRKGSSVVFSCCDNGPGVPKEQLGKIFDRFYRVDTSRSREMGGTGLGLAICKDIIEAHGGHIEARNGEEGGLCILFDLPIFIERI